MSLAVCAGPVAALAVLVGVSSLGCSGRRLPAGDWEVRFGPVLGGEAIVGRVMVGRRIWLATSEPALVRIDVDGHRHSRQPIGPLETGEQIWGLAASSVGLWTLAGYDTLAQVGIDGRIEQRVALATPHMNVMSGHGDLLYQLVSFEPGIEAVYTGPPGDAGRRPWGAMRARDLPLPRAQALILNTISCGPPGPAGIPCWFVDRPIVTLTNAAGESTDIELEALSAVAPAAFFGAAPPRRPIFDVHQTADGGLWVLAGGEPSTPALSGERGGWLLARYTPEGRRTGSVQLPEPARLLLGVTDASCLLLSWNGHVVEVATPRTQAE